MDTTKTVAPSPSVSNADTGSPSAAPTPPPEQMTVLTTTSSSASSSDRALALLFAGIVFSCVCLIATAKWLPQNHELATVFAGLASGFSAAFFRHIVGPGS